MIISGSYLPQSGPLLPLAKCIPLAWTTKLCQKGNGIYCIPAAQEFVHHSVWLALSVTTTFYFFIFLHASSFFWFQNYILFYHHCQLKVTSQAGPTTLPTRPPSFPANSPVLSLAASPGGNYSSKCKIRGELKTALTPKRIKIQEFWGYFWKAQISIMDVNTF